MRKAPKIRFITPKRCCGSCEELRFDGGIGYCFRSHEQNDDDDIFPDVHWDAGELERPWHQVCDYWIADRYS